jgi:hypothetical protein
MRARAVGLSRCDAPRLARLKAQGDDRFVGLPVPLSRMFRHSCIYVRADAGIATPQDLRGRAVGAVQLDSTGAVFIKGMLAHEHGVRADEIRWVCGGLETPAQIKRPAAGHGSWRRAYAARGIGRFMPPAELCRAALQRHVVIARLRPAGGASSQFHSA